MKITVVYNKVENIDVGSPTDILADEDTVKTAIAIAEAIDGELFELNEKTAKKLLTLETDFFFNTAFGIGNAPKSESEVANLLEKTRKPYSGSTAKTLVLTTDKTATKSLLLSWDLPTPKFQIFSGEEKITKDLKFPLIAKPNGEDCSLGITESSVVSNPKQLYDRIKALQEKYSEAVLVEEYIDGRELNVTVIGNGQKTEVLPVSEITFGPSFNGKYKVVDFSAKWEEGTSRYKETVGICPAVLNEDIRKKIEKISLEAFKVTGCRDYARVDFRLSKDNVPYILEVNANPAIGPDDGATRSAKVAGYDYHQFLQKIIDVAMERYGSS